MKKLDGLKAVPIQEAEGLAQGFVDAGPGYTGGRIGRGRVHGEGMWWFAPMDRLAM